MIHFSATLVIEHFVLLPHFVFHVRFDAVTYNSGAVKGWLEERSMYSPGSLWLSFVLNDVWKEL